jgi:hypothetical protein
VQISAEDLAELKDGLANEIQFSERVKRNAAWRLEYSGHAGNVYSPVIMVDGESIFGTRVFVSKTSAKDAAESYARAYNNIIDEGQGIVICWTIAIWTLKEFGYQPGKYYASVDIDDVVWLEDELPDLSGL